MTITNPSALVAAPEGRALPTDALPEIHLIAPEPSALGAEFRDKIGDNLTNRPRIVAFVGVNGTVEPFLFQSFHGGLYGD